MHFVAGYDSKLSELFHHNSMMRPNRLVCLCNHVTAQEIVNCLKAGALTTAEIQEFTHAGTGCTRCVREIDALVALHHSKPNKDHQLRLNFE